MLLHDGQSGRVVERTAHRDGAHTVSSSLFAVSLRKRRAGVLTDVGPRGYSLVCLCEALTVITIQRRIMHVDIGVGYNHVIILIYRLFRSVVKTIDLHSTPRFVIYVSSYDNK